MDKPQSDIDKIISFNQKKERLFRQIIMENLNACELCPYNPNYGFGCELKDCTIIDDFKTAVLSLDKKENYPNLFEGK